MTIAIADAASDALGIHISEESKVVNDSKHVWESTLATFFFKFVFAFSFLIPLSLLCIHDAVIASVIWGFSLLTVFSYYIARIQEETAILVILEHIMIAIAVVITSYYVGAFVNATIL